MTRARRRRDAEFRLQTHCLEFYAAQSRVDGTPYYHLCELPPRHSSWHLCWCGCAFTNTHVVGYQQQLDLGADYWPRATHEPI